ncbi:hypothetical protein EDEG_03478 [Edhazardia aedis USNM 41457]|uniref:Uncharacterized protein n=1 Tax=Edhazardia aedis (strain USNM 41457) TaxID=1003232 RepID=J9D2Q3_EDHAE|nr:hypothetical protein EDEG_03478 [Edhazardia aedis USNM 41457]|eukprot:EJW02076.1 hypothetical protein EDEG_03478 [Edhazardia aedis USNM 41457]
MLVFFDRYYTYNRCFYILVYKTRCNITDLVYIIPIKNFFKAFSFFAKKVLYILDIQTKLNLLLLAHELEFYIIFCFFVIKLHLSSKINTFNIDNFSVNLNPKFDAYLLLYKNTFLFFFSST